MDGGTAARTKAEATAIATVPGRPVGSLLDTARKADDYARHARAENTKRAYRSDWADFSAWCSAHGLAPITAAPSTVRLYLVELADRCKVATLRRRLASVSKAHQVAGHPSPSTAPDVRETFAGIRRALGTAPTAKAAATVDLLRRMVEDLNGSPAGLRDRALLLLGFVGAFRRSELVGLNVEDLAPVREGLLVTLRRSKTDQEGKGRRGPSASAHARRRVPFGPSKPGARRPVSPRGRSSAMSPGGPPCLLGGSAIGPSPWSSSARPRRRASTRAPSPGTPSGPDSRPPPLRPA